MQTHGESHLATHHVLGGLAAALFGQALRVVELRGFVVFMRFNTTYIFAVLV
jgi:hypothetical protein